MKDRKEELLRATYQFLKNLETGQYHDEITIHYDEADCDYLCLRDDIAIELGIEN